MRFVSVPTDTIRKRVSFFEFSLCLSRACLGNMISFSIKRREKTRFLTWLAELLKQVVQLGRIQGAATVSVSLRKLRLERIV
jgi:predicted amidophosphoribosyltransferase